ncbi:hypothetical protein DYH09_26085 [bacterium CPR1]|nr:hypothetical protein [bacterium CPR1]
MQDKKEKLVLRTFKRREDPFPPPGQPVSKTLYPGNYVLFCSASSCVHYHGMQGSLPFWSEDAPEVLDVLRCPECGSPAVRPPREHPEDSDA